MWTIGCDGVVVALPGGETHGQGDFVDVPVVATDATPEVGRDGNPCHVRHLHWGAWEVESGIVGLAVVPFVPAIDVLRGDRRAIVEVQSRVGVVASTPQIVATRLNNDRYLGHRGSAVDPGGRHVEIESVRVARLSLQGRAGSHDPDCLVIETNG